MDASCSFGWVGIHNKPGPDQHRNHEEVTKATATEHLEQQQKPKTICTQRRQQMLLRCCLVLLTAAILWRCGCRSRCRCFCPNTQHPRQDSKPKYSSPC
ncbi:uncharacterized protein LOC116801090 [Drosophila sechellia]|uniref:uncharacterized protein LOC116801090 n=1 Tax=Drosophila sechellia TaxID=7238 RepID=UPI0013DE5B65|nr:uncharacterized protein LOC116801090 [Drosophila sechellia]